MQSRKRPTAFTLVELLVVVGIIALLIGFLLPALGVARQAARGAACLANMRSISIAAETYEANNHGGLILDAVTLLVPDQTKGQTIVRRLVYCPAFLDYLDTSGKSSGSQVTYGFNSWLSAFGAELSPGKLKPGTIRDPADVVLVADTVYLTQKGINFSGGQGLQDPFWACALNTPPQNSTPLAPTFHGRHNGGNGAVLWVDGHASMVHATPVPLSLPSPATMFTDLQQPPAVYNKLHIGYLVRSPKDLYSLAAEYYYVVSKDMLSTNDISRYVIAVTSPVGLPTYYAPRPEVWH